MDSEARVNVYLNNCCKLLQGQYRKVNSQVVNATNKIDVNNAENGHLQARHAKKKKDRTTGSRKWKCHEVTKGRC